MLSDLQNRSVFFKMVFKKFSKLSLYTLNEGQYHNQQIGGVVWEYLTGHSKIGGHVYTIPESNFLLISPGQWMVKGGQLEM